MLQHLAFAEAPGMKGAERFASLNCAREPAVTPVRARLASLPSCDAQFGWTKRSLEVFDHENAPETASLQEHFLKAEVFLLDKKIADRYTIIVHCSVKEGDKPT